MATDENPYQAPLPGEPRARPRRPQPGAPHIGWAVLATIVGVMFGGAMRAPPFGNRVNESAILGGLLGLLGYFTVRCMRFIGSKLWSTGASQQSETDLQD